MKTNNLHSVIFKIFNVVNFIEVKETNNSIEIVIDKHLEKSGIETQNFRISCIKFGNNRNAKTKLNLFLYEPLNNDLLFYIVKELQLIIHNKFYSIDDCKDLLNLK